MLFRASLSVVLCLFCLVSSAQWDEPAPEGEEWEPISEAGITAWKTGIAAVKAGDVDAAAKAYLAVVVDSGPDDKEDTIYADATFALLLRELPEEGGISYQLAYWKAVHTKYPAPWIELRYWRLAKDVMPWNELAPLLVARGDFQAWRWGFIRMDDEPELAAESAGFQAGIVAYLPKATVAELRELLLSAVQFQLRDLAIAISTQLRKVMDPSESYPLETKGVLEVVHGVHWAGTESSLEALMAGYDLATMMPAMEESTMSGPGETPEAVEKLKELRALYDHIAGKGDKVMWEGIAAYNALVKAYPRYSAAYEHKAELLRNASLTADAVLSLTDAIRLAGEDATSDLFYKRAGCWLLLNRRSQAMADMNYVLVHVDTTDERALQLFCELAVRDWLKDDGSLPADWEGLISRRLEVLEDRYPKTYAGSSFLLLTAIEFWDRLHNYTRARSALAFYKERATEGDLARHANAFAAWEARWYEAAPPRLFLSLPAAPAPHGEALVAGLKVWDVGQVWAAYSAWLAQDPWSVEVRLYGAAALADLEAPYLALALLDDAMALKPSAEMTKALAQVRAYAEAQLGETVAAALAYAKSVDSNEPSTYWLMAFVEVNQQAAYGRIGERALAALSAEALDPAVLAWAWQTYQVTAPLAAVEAWHEKLREAGTLPGEPEPVAADAARQMVVAWRDYQVATGELTGDDWWLLAKLAAADGRQDDAAFAAAYWLLGLAGERDDAAAEEAMAMVMAYRDGKAADGDLEEALRRNPCNLEVMVKAYEAARESGDMFRAAAYLRHVWLAYGDDRIDLLTACNVATAAADWELLLSVSQQALAKAPSDTTRGWYALALTACGREKTAISIRGQMDDDPMRVLIAEILGWLPFVSVSGGYVASISSGNYADLHGAIRDAALVKSHRQSAKENPASAYNKTELAKAEAAMRQRLVVATATQKVHIQFLLGEISPEAYLAAFDNTEDQRDDRACAQIFIILSKWQQARKAALAGEDLADVQAIMYDQGQHLRLRCMAYAMLRMAKIMPSAEPLRATDPLLPGYYSTGEARQQLEAGRLMIIHEGDNLMGSLGGSVRVTFPAHKTRREFKLPKMPPVSRVRIAPDLPEQRLTGLTAENYEKRMIAFAEVGLKPVLDRRLTTLEEELKAASTNAEERYAAYWRAGWKLRNMGVSFYFDMYHNAEAVFAVIAPHIERYPQDAYYAITQVRVLGFDYDKRVSKRAQDVIRLGRQASTNQGLGDIRTIEDLNKSTLAVQKVLAAYPPGSKEFAFVDKALAAGKRPEEIKSAVAAEKARLRQEEADRIRRAELVKEYDAAMRRGNMYTVGRVARQLGGNYYVQWALNDSRVTLEQLLQARAYASGADSARLADEINRRNNAMYNSQRQRSYSGSSSGGTSWSSFTSQMSAKRDAAYAHQRARDEKNGIRYVKPLR